MNYKKILELFRLLPKITIFRFCLIMKQSYTKSILVFIIFSILSTGFSKTSYLKLGRTTDMPSIGVKMKMPKNTKAKPLLSLSSLTLTRRRGTEVKKLDIFNSRDLWIRDQLVGQWEGKGVVVSVYKLTLKTPDTLSIIYEKGDTKFVLKDAYSEWKDNQKDVVWDKDSLSDYIAYVVDAKVSPVETPMKKGGAKRAVTYAFDIASSAGRNMVYLVSPSSKKGTFYLVNFLLDSDYDSSKSKKNILKCVGGMTFYNVKKSKKDSKKKIISKNDRGSTKKRTPEYIASRDRVINNIQNLKSWWYLESDNFILVGNIKNKKSVTKLRDGLEETRDVFSNIYPITRPLNAVSVAKLFNTREEYIAYVSEDFKWSAGLWMSNRKELVVSPSDWGSIADRRKRMVNIIQHEGFHQYIYFATGKQHCAVWFNEGNATFFEGIKFKGKRAVITETWHLKKVMNLAPTINIPALLKMTSSEFYSGSKDRNYPSSYGLMFFLHKGAPVMKKKNSYSEIPTKYYNALIETKNPKKATEIAWEGVDMEKFISDFRKFWSSKKLIKKALRYDLIKAKKLEFVKK